MRQPADAPPAPEESPSKALRLTEVAELLLDRAAFASLGSARQFCAQYFRHIEDEDVLGRTPESVLALLEAHLRLAEQRLGDGSDGEPAVHVWTPTTAADGWEAPGEATVVQLVMRDQPFIVDSVQMELLRQGWTIRELFHPQFVVRHEDGRILECLDGRNTESGAESWIHAEIVPAPGRQPDRELEAALAAGLRRVLGDVEAVVRDWSVMRERALEVSDELAVASSPHAEQDRSAAIELMRWLAANNFTLLGYREYRLKQEEGSRRYVAVPGTGLGILTDDEAAAHRFGANPPTAELPQLVVITKDSAAATVHRPTQMDYIGVRIFDSSGHVIGEKRFLGLFGASAYSESVMRIPPLRAKAHAVMEQIGYRPESHGGKAVLSVLNNYPRDELFQTRVAVLAPLVEKIAHLRERRQVRLFSRRDPYSRYLSVLVFFPRDRYTTAVRERMQDILLTRLHGAAVEHEARVGESVLARLHFIVRMPQGVRVGSYSEQELAAELTQATRSWNDLLYDEVAASPTIVRRDEVAEVFPEGYKEDFSPRQATLDLDELAKLDGERDMSMVIYAPERDRDLADLRLKIFRAEAIPLSLVLPHLTRLGVDVLDERPYGVTRPGGARAHVLDFGLKVDGGAAAVAQRWTREARARFTDAFAASYSGRCESDALNALIMAAGLTWRQVSWLRAVSRYLQQAGTTFSQAYIAAALVEHQEIASDLVRLFETRFDPTLELAGDAPPLTARAERAEQVLARIDTALDKVGSIDHDRIVRSFVTVIKAMIRTNAFAADRAALAFKLRPREVDGLPEPRPAFEIFVYSPRLEGVHLRFGSVARGGLRWSDRAEDFRTEILGLVKAQMVKNTVIVPVGAKGGFYCKQLAAAADRAAEGQACYRIFITSLLELTDNLVDGEVVPPADTVRWDGDDSYLVVAADKGTATFSDLANAISTERGFWLGDAFASGGSIGYDHKAMGITARGAWESVKRHFRELGITGDFTCVGVGDMAGDVFGNGMLLSRNNKLVAAFNHQHIFLDPDPDPEVSFAERRRLFETPGSTWAHYDPALISAGGGVYSRTAKSVPISPEVRRVLGLQDSVTALEAAPLVRAILQAPVDLFWNGGIGTYVKASSETNAEVGDKANDAVRIDGSQLRARAVGEGGNLGLTQLGRVEYARAGGRINTDFIDNSAGVDTSDHEVNIKILLQPQVASGRLSEADRRSLLAQMTDEVAGLVLSHNDDQNIALANAVHQAPAMAVVHESWMERLEEEGMLDRAIEFLPDEDEMTARIAAGEGLSAPELSVLLSYTKIWLEEQILASDLPDDGFLHDRLVRYFPEELRSRFKAEMDAHPLRREIITTVAINRFVNSSGITSAFRLSESTGAAPADLIRAQLASRSIFHAGEHEVALRQLDDQLPADVLTEYRLRLRTLVERGTRWLLANRRAPIDVQAMLEEFADPVRRFHVALPELLGEGDRALLEQRRHRLLELGFDENLALVGAGLPLAHVGLPLSEVAGALGRDVLEAGRTHFLLGERLGVDALGRGIAALPRRDRWEDLARGALRNDLQEINSQLVRAALSAEAEGTAEQAVEAWFERQGAAAQTTAKALAEIGSGAPDLARLSVGLRAVRGLVN